MADLSFSNPVIRDYFERISNNPPVGEFMYIHSHFVEINFLSEIESRVFKAGLSLVTSSRKTGLGLKFKTATEKLGASMSVIDESTCPIILENLRVIYDICKESEQENSK